MEDKEIFYYEAKYRYEEGKEGKFEYKEKTQYGFVYANGYCSAAKTIEEYFGEDLIMVTLEAIGYLDLLGIHDKELAHQFKEKFLTEI